jgi:hypothetical protein
MNTKLLLLFCALSGLLACSPSSGTIPTHGRTTLTPPTPTAENPTPTILPYEACGWVWAQESLPETSAALTESLAAQDLKFDADRTYAYAFGENCLGPNGQVDHFAAQETDFVVVTGLAGPDGYSERADYAGAVLKLILADFKPVETVPGQKQGFVEFVFQDSKGESHQRVALADAEKALASGLTGEALYQALFP